MLKRLMTWLCPSKNVQQQFRVWARVQTWPDTKKYGQCAMPPAWHAALIVHVLKTRWVVARGPSGLFLVDGIECYPDPTVTEFTARKPPRELSDLVDAWMNKIRQCHERKPPRMGTRTNP